MGIARVRLPGRGISRPRPQPGSSMPRSACGARMSDHSSDDGRCSGPPGSLTAAGAQDSGSPNEHEGGRGGLAAPRHRNDDCMQAYASHGLSGIGSESSPSCGWKAVYAAMGVNPDGHD